MVVKKTEYLDKFKSSVVRNNRSAYLENLNFRHQRRDREFVHTPICWQESGTEEEVESSDETGDSPHVLPSRKGQEKQEASNQYQSLAEIISEAKEKAEVYKQKRCDKVILQDLESPEKESCNAKISSLEKQELPLKKCYSGKNMDSSEVAKSDVDKSLSIYDMINEENRKLNQKLAGTYKVVNGKITEDISDETDTDRDMKAADKLQADAKENEANLRVKKYSRRKRRPQHKRVPSSKSDKVDMERKGKVQNCEPSKERPVSSLSQTKQIRRPDRVAQIPIAQHPRPVTSGSENVENRPPFIAYGAGDKEDSLAVHRTHNVRSLADVYLPALKAKLRREEERRRQRELQREARNAKAVLEKLAAATPRDLVDWRSEYQKQYHGYEPKDYEKAVTSRCVIPRASAMRAVNRGGCLVVHVD